MSIDFLVIVFWQVQGGFLTNCTNVVSSSSHGILTIMVMFEGYLCCKAHLCKLLLQNSGEHIAVFRMSLLMYVVPPVK
ncbi:hypothetical protein AQUCO_03300134v1 [Aquilegia coerulea]|uniref:Uncharacterized protein n=1 Tax=Aquilegia coerulea TaxID=218851 RepID=A0A2G5CZM3_AQUCA|nr:hypothetical protein AQUCO_03300134v1 [Aquilegia coerulea]